MKYNAPAMKQAAPRKHDPRGGWTQEYTERFKQRQEQDRREKSQRPK